MNKVVIATRESALALWQANRIKDLLLNADPKLQVEILGMTTEGDQKLETSLAKIGGKVYLLKSWNKQCWMGALTLRSIL